MRSAGNNWVTIRKPRAQKTKCKADTTHYTSPHEKNETFSSLSTFSFGYSFERKMLMDVFTDGFMPFKIALICLTIYAFIA
jgi:hypothetical protein